MDLVGGLLLVGVVHDIVDPHAPFLVGFIGCHLCQGPLVLWFWFVG